MRKNTLMEVEHKGDKTIFHHVEDLSPYMKEAKRLRDAEGSNRMKGDSYLRMAVLPPLIFSKYPHLRDDEKALKKFLESDEGRRFKATNRRLI